jgi:predicted nucleotidyltransferase
MSQRSSQFSPAAIGPVIARLIRAFAPDRIVLFGSYAKGAQQVGSDIDLLVVADLEGDMMIHMTRAGQLAGDCFPPVDIVFCTTDELANASTARSPFLSSILEVGITIYTRTQHAPIREATRPRLSAALPTERAAR